MQETWEAGLVPGWGRSPGGEHDNPLQYSCLENLMDRRASQATVHGAPQSQTQLKWLSTHTACALPQHLVWLLVYHTMRRQSLDLVTFPEQSYYQRYLERYAQLISPAEHGGENLAEPRVLSPLCIQAPLPSPANSSFSISIWIAFLLFEIPTITCNVFFSSLSKNGILSEGSGSFWRVTQFSWVSPMYICY